MFKSIILSSLSSSAAAQEARTDVNRYLRHVIGALSSHVMECMEQTMRENTEQETQQYLAEARKRPFQDGEQPMVSSKLLNM